MDGGEWNKWWESEMSEGKDDVLKIWPRPRLFIRVLLWVVI
jgi:hypothetical protein